MQGYILDGALIDTVSAECHFWYWVRLTDHIHIFLFFLTCTYNYFPFHFRVEIAVLRVPGTEYIETQQYLALVPCSAAQDAV